MKGVAPLFVGGGRGAPPPASNRPHDHGLHHVHAMDVGKNGEDGSSGKVLERGS
jgi:hypothetical protein